MRIFGLGIALVAWCGLSPCSVMAATDVQARAIVSEFERAQKLWLTEMKLAPSAAAMEMIKKKQPDPSSYAKRLKTLLNRDLDKEWTLKYGAWLLKHDSNLKPGSQRALLNAVEKYHLGSPELGEFALAMVYLREGNEVVKNKIPLQSRAIMILESIKTKNPHQQVQGQAALALALMYSSLGEGGDVMRKRLSNLREAVKKSADIKVEDRTVGDIVKEQLYIIMNLSKGREAPNLVGGDSAGRPIQLKDYRGKIVMLVFWSSFDIELEQMNRALEMLRRTNLANVDQPFVLLGVNRDDLKNLRALEADRIVTWRNISDPQQKIAKAYHIPSWPYCMVLDKQGVIHYSGALGSFAEAVATGLLANKP